MNQPLRVLNDNNKTFNDEEKALILLGMKCDIIKPMIGLWEKMNPGKKSPHNAVLECERYLKLGKLPTVYDPSSFQGTSVDKVMLWTLETVKAFGGNLKAEKKRQNQILMGVASWD